MDPLLILLIIVAILALSGWGYGTYSYRPAPGRDEVVAAPAWINPVGIIGLIAVVALIMMFAMGWRVGP